MTTLTDRYLAATLRAAPPPRREEIANELRGSIEDMIEGRVAAGRDAETAEREVLTELGNPAELAARYTGRRLQLIGPTYYLTWQRLLKLLLSLVPPIVGVVVGLVTAISGEDPGGAIGKAITTALQVAVHVAFWVTLVFAMIERIAPRLDLPKWTVDELPEDRGDRQINLCDTLASVAFLALLIAGLVIQHFWSFLPNDRDGNLPLLNPALWSFWLPFLIGVLVASIGLELAVYWVGRWIWPLVAVKAVIQLAFGAPVIWLLLNDRLLNPELTRRFAWLARPDHLELVTTLAVLGTALVTVGGVADSAIKAYRARR